MQNEGIDNDLNNCVDWYNATPEQINEYSDYLYNQLAGVTVPIEALRCTARSCIILNEKLQNYHDQIINACIVAGIETLGRVSDATTLTNRWLAGASTWTSTNSAPLSGTDCGESIVSNKIARSLVSGNPKSFWDDVKKIKGNS